MSTCFRRRPTGSHLLIINGVFLLGVVIAITTRDCNCDCKYTGNYRTDEFMDGADSLARDDTPVNLDSSSSQSADDNPQSEGDLSLSVSDTSQTGGDTSQTEGDMSQSEGDTSQGEGDMSQSVSDTSQTDGDMSQSEGDTSQTEYDTSQPQGDISQNEGDTLQNLDNTPFDLLRILRLAKSASSLDEIGENPIRDKIEKYRLKCVCPEPPKWLMRSDKNSRRLEMAKEMERDMEKKLQPLVKCEALSPVSYYGSGITVEPFESVPLVGISIHDFVINALRQDDNFLHFKFQSINNLGILYVPKDVVQRSSTLIRLEGVNTATLDILVAGRDLGILNTVVDNVVYQSTSYHIDRYDQIEISFLGFSHRINVHIRRQPLPDLIDPGQDGISSQVTVITKTFERYDCLGRFVINVRKFYPGVPIIIADDSEFPEIVNASNLKHFTMPFRDGCFAGRNLALSQVRTKYVVFADDDFIFTNETRLESMIEKLEDPKANLDIISGHIQNLTSLDYIFRLVKGVDGKGMCSMGVYGMIDRERRRVPGYPQCVYAEMANNFFMAKTSVLRRIGFEPGFVYAGHEEFWMDAVGKAQSAVCLDVHVDHYRTETTKYGGYRWQTETIRKRDPHLLFENNLCYWRNWVFDTKPKIVQ